MGKYDSRHGVTGIFLVPPNDRYENRATNILTDYSWADTVYFETFTSYSGISAVTGGFGAGAKFTMSNGAHYPSGVTGGNADIYITDTEAIIDATPSSANFVKDAIPDSSNVGSNNVESTGSWTGTQSQTYVVRIAQAGVAGVAKCDVYGPTGDAVSEDNVITNGGTVTCSGAMELQFNDDGPFYLHDSWAVRGVTGGIWKLVVDVDSFGTGSVDYVSLVLDGTGDQTTALDGVNNILINSGYFGVPFDYLTDYDENQIGNNLHIKIRASKDTVNDYLVIRGLYIGMGDAEEYTTWS